MEQYPELLLVLADHEVVPVHSNRRSDVSLKTLRCEQQSPLQDIASRARLRRGSDQLSKSFWSTLRCFSMIDCARHRPVRSHTRSTTTRHRGRKKERAKTETEEDLKHDDKTRHDATKTRQASTQHAKRDTWICSISALSSRSLLNLSLYLALCVSIISFTFISSSFSASVASEPSPAPRKIQTSALDVGSCSFGSLHSRYFIPRTRSILAQRSVLDIA